MNKSTLSLPVSTPSEKKIAESLTIAYDAQLNESTYFLFNNGGMAQVVKHWFDIRLLSQRSRVRFPVFTTYLVIRIVWIIIPACLIK